MKLSPWWDAVTQPPVHVGEYETRRVLHWDQYWREMSYWDGATWSKGKWLGMQWRGVLREDEA